MALVIVLVIFVTATIILATTLPSLYLIASHSSRVARGAIADACAAELSQVAPGDEATLKQTAETLRRRFNVQSVEVALRATTPPPGESIERRSTRHGIVEVRFAPDPMERHVRMLRIAAGAGVIASLAGVILLLTQLAALATSADPARAGRAPSTSSYLFETFETSIKTMKGRETELRRLRDREKERADELATVSGMLVRSMASGFIAADADGAIVDMNQPARDLLGIEESAPTSGRPVIEALGDTAFARTLQSAIEKRLALQRHEVIEESSRMVIGLATVPLSDERGRSLGMLALFTDLTPMRKLETRIHGMQSLADLGEMSAGIAHEFRNSLSTILGYLRLARKAALPTEAAERVARAEEEARQLNGAVESLLNFARPVTLQLQRVSLREIFADVIEQLRPIAAGIDISLEGEDAVVEGDAMLLRRVAENLLRNAVEAVRAREGARSIEVRLAAMPAPSIAVHDDGVGIPNDQIARLFLPFQSTKANGFGLGLALTKKIVLVHGGTIAITSEPGNGTTVNVELAPRIA